MSCHYCPYRQQCVLFGGELDLGCEEIEQANENDDVILEPEEIYEDPLTEEDDDDDDYEDFVQDFFLLMEEE